jgi:hypothetical protein
MWQIMGFNITKKNPSITAMSVHLSAERRVQKYIQNNNSDTLSPFKHYFFFFTWFLSQ